MQLQTLFSLLPALAALPAINAYFILSHPVLETTRLDPIVNPGGIGSHVHSIVGGNNFDNTMTYESARAGTCTTAPITVDKSSYWIPQLYYYNPSDATYQMVPVDYVNTYYLPRAGSDGVVQAFPDGLRMVSGSADRRTYNGDADSNAISYVCLDYTTSHSGDAAWDQRNSFFEHNCPSGMRAQVNFRPCWDGVNLDSDDHQSHMAWPSGGVDGGDCPSTHPVHLVSLFYEFIYNVQDFPYNNGTDPTWVWANGDTTGYGLHGDFLNGWPEYANGTGILQQAIDQCNADNGVGGVLSACPPFVNYIDSDSANACKPGNDLVDEDIGDGHYISQLPGNNPIWIGNTTKPSYANYTDDGIGYTSGKSVIPSGYTQVGCIAEGTSGRALTGKSFSSANMTLGACVSWCEAYGYPLAGVEYADECYCDFAMRNGASNTTLLSDDKCGMTCANNTNENCGGSATLTLFNNPSLYPVSSLPAGWSSYGCMTEATNARALSGYSTSSSSMTQEICMSTCQAKGFTYAGVEYASECYCGNSFNTGSVAASSGCSMACSGNSLETCGGGNRLTTFVYSNSTTTSSVVSSTSASVSSSAAANKTVAATSTPANTTVAATSTAINSTVAATSTVVNTTVAATSTARNVTSTVASSSASTSQAGNTTVAATSAASNVTSTVASTSTSTSKIATTTASSSVSSAVASSSSSASSSSASSSASKASTTSTIVTSSTSSATSSSSSSSAAKSSSTSSSTSATSSVTSSSSSSKAASSTTTSSSTSTASSTTSTSKASTTTAATSTSTSAAATASATGYQGCFNDINTRQLNGTMISNTTMTNENCQGYCASKGYAFSGNEYTRECWCGNYLNMTLQIADSKCSYPCAGNSAEKCGGSMILSIFSTGAGTQHVYGTSSISKRLFSAKWRL